MRDGELRNPFVVQCRECKKIITDSFTLQTMKHGHLVHTFSTLSPCEPVHAGSGIFENCTLQDLLCQCTTRVGVLIVSAGGDWNGCAEMYAFPKEHITSYVLGNTVFREKGIGELAEDVEKLKSVVARMYRKIYQ